VYREGFWAPDKDTKSKFPFPVESENQIGPKFVEKMNDVMDFISRHKGSQYGCTQYKGVSYCRLCNYRHNGSCEFWFYYKGKKYVFPEGLNHYFEEHSVHPTADFKKAIKAFKL
jgi:hypothetical protein